MNPFYLSDTYALVRLMKLAGNQQGLIARWIEGVGTWAAREHGPDAEAVRAWLPHWQVRPWYSAAELAPLWPALALSLGINERLMPVKSAERLKNELLFSDLPRLTNADGTLEFHGKEYFIVERLHYWKKRKLTTEEFDEHYT